MVLSYPSRMGYVTDAYTTLLVYAERTKPGLEALRQYHRAYNEWLRTFRNTPYMIISHAADAFRYLAVGLKENTQLDRPPQAVA